MPGLSRDDARDVANARRSRGGSDGSEVLFRATFVFTAERAVGVQNFACSLKGADQLASVGVAVFGMFVQTAIDDIDQAGRNIRAEIGDRRMRLVHGRHEHFHHDVTLKGSPPGQQRVDRRAHAEDVGAFVGGLGV